VCRRKREQDKPKKRSVIDGGITFFTIMATIFHTTVGFFVYKAWEYLWGRWKAKRSKEPENDFADKK
jgi:hypothetical protein